MTKSVLKVTLLFPILVLVLMGCPYESKVPISSPSVKVDHSLLGQWVKIKDSENEHPDFFEITQLNDMKYKIAKNTFSTTDSAYKAEDYIAHTTKIENTTFLNMERDGKFYLHKLEQNGNTFKLYEVTDNIDEQFDNSDDLYAFVKQYMKLSFFYNKDEEAYKKQ